MYCRKKLNLDSEKVNVNGGAMALGHPLGATGNYLIISFYSYMVFNFISAIVIYKYSIKF